MTKVWNVLLCTFQRLFDSPENLTSLAETESQVEVKAFQLIYGENIIQGKYYTGKIFYGEDIIRGKYYTGKLLYGENIIQGKYYMGKLSKVQIKTWLIGSFAIRQP